jgi:adenylosuccinate synthase
MALDVLLGLQWGDEGKGKIVDVLSAKYDVVARFQGGPNAGHSLEFDGKSIVLHLIPSGIFREGTKNLIGGGVVLDPVTLLEEVSEVEHFGADIKSGLFISHKAHLILPTHRILDKASEIAKGKNKIGSTLKGIGPAYMDKIGRNGLRIGDIFEPGFENRYKRLKEKHYNLIEAFAKDFEFDITDEERKWFEAVESLRSFNVVNGEYFINEALVNGKNILAEGAQGTLLDIDFGTYPYVTSSNTISAGVSTGLGVAPHKINEVFGIFKAYTTRVGSGPFPTELNDATGQRLRDLGREYGATTGRPRRCGWLDLVALSYAVMINGVTSLIVTKADVLSGFDKVKAAVAYNVAGNYTEKFPFDVSSVNDVKYREFDGWKEDLSSIEKFDSLPAEFKEYLKFVENKTGVPVRIISTGPDRKQTIFV